MNRFHRRNRDEVIAKIAERMEWLMSAQDSINAGVAALNDLVAASNDAAAKLNADVAELVGLEKVDTSALDTASAAVADAKAKLAAAVASVSNLVPPAPKPVANPVLDANGNPVLDANGNPTFIGANGEPVDANGNPIA